jgi:hypothetical protein
MTKQDLLKKLHKLVWADDDLMDQDNLFKMQEIIDNEILSEAYPRQGKPTMLVFQLPNGYIKSIKVLKEEDNGKRPE